MIYIASTNLDIGMSIVGRPLKENRETFFEVTVPQDGVTIALNTHQGMVAVCGSTTQRPSCFLSSFYDWNRDVGNFADIFITAEGIDADSGQSMARCLVMSQNLSIFMTVQGILGNNTFSMNTSLGDTRLPRGIIIVMYTYVHYAY